MGRRMQCTHMGTNLEGKISEGSNLEGGACGQSQQPKPVSIVPPHQDSGRWLLRLRRQQLQSPLLP